MLKTFEELSQYAMQYPIAFNELDKFQLYMSNLMGNVNFIDNMIHSDNFSADSENWKSAVSKFRNELGPLTRSLKNEIEKIMQQT